MGIFGKQGASEKGEARKIIFLIFEWPLFTLSLFSFLYKPPSLVLLTLEQYY
jgi:hypothetical protein